MSSVTHPGLASFLKEHSNNSSGRPRMAVFDCDGTVIKGDIGEAMYYYQIENFLFRTSPAAVWPHHPRHAELEGRFQRLSQLAGEDRSSSADFAPFAEILLSWYFDRIAEGNVIEACADIVRLLAGFTTEEVRSMADAACAFEFASPPGKRILGKRSLPLGIRYIREATELIGELQARRFDIWVVSGSCTWSVEPVFRPLGIPAGRIVGIELIERDGVLTDTPITPIPIREGKIGALQRRVSAIPLLVASDSKNDIPLFLYSSGLKVRINSRERNTGEFFRAANVQPDESWVLIESPTILPP